MVIRLTKWLAAAPLAALLCLPGASAAPLLPPMDLHAEPGAPGTALLAWSPPPDASGPVAYAVYANGARVATVDEPRYAVPAGFPILYSVTVLDAAGEGLPAFLLVGHVHFQGTWPLDGAGLVPRCPPMGTNVYTHYPFVAVMVYEECLKPWPPE